MTPRRVVRCAWCTIPGRTKEQAYRVTERWLINNGREALKHLAVGRDERKAWVRVQRPFSSCVSPP